MNITVICLGKLKEKYLSDAIKEYSKRISPYGKLDIIELTPVKLSENPSEAEIKTALEKEAIEIIKKTPQNAFIIPLCIEGDLLSSEELAYRFKKISLSGKSNIVFIIGSSYGLADIIKEQAHLRLSFSKMTFPHQLMRVMLLEQIYRAFQINNNGKYHK
ncbi:MAG: 23S rRNA (pseudouridine(1915)-N(3))-methyltransferase RlmH [Ruminococcaceae bacterium]|nr:23S rRNA (pseudouridine(1915)-N(3))-methyltransferase RlmH [Oscillospiraceae bacterium]